MGLHRARTLLAATSAVALLAVGLGSQTGAQAAPDRASFRDDVIAPAAPGTVRMTQANLLSGQPEASFQADLAKIFTSKPDFVTYNEVTYRVDTNLAPPTYTPADGSAPVGYSLFRAAPSGNAELDKYTRSNPVAWRSDRWAPLAMGTTNISNNPGRDKGQSTDLGIRYANWVTLRSPEGYVVSVVATHIAPEGTYSSGLLGPSVANLNTLTNSLAPAGPVLIGGDFNVAYRSATYNAVPWASYAMTPTFDVVGSAFPTGDHFGNTIDYLFLKQASQFTVQGQYSTVLNSDHNAVTADLAFTGATTDQPAAFFPGKLVNTPAGGKLGRRAVLDLMVKAVDGAPEGARLQLQTASFSDTTLFRSLKKAINRGVKVQVVVGDKRLNGKERKLLKKLGSTFTKREFLVTCSASAYCAKQARTKQLPATQLLVSQAGTTSKLRIDADQPAVNKMAKNLTTATVMTTASEFSFAQKKFLRLGGRSGK